MTNLMLLFQHGNLSESEIASRLYDQFNVNLSESEIASRLYDQFNVTITDVKILLADSGIYRHKGCLRNILLTSALKYCLMM